MPLSNKDRHAIKMTAEARPGDADYIEAAYALGVERARVVAPLEWTEWLTLGKSTFRKAKGAGMAYIEFKDADVAAWSDGLTRETLPNADAAQQHHAARVLALLVAP